MRTRPTFQLRSKQAGFTLIELVVVIVILGILAASALPKFIDLSADANLAATKGVAGAISSASAVNYAGRKANSTKGQAIANCTDVGGILQGGTMPANYTMTAAVIAVDATVSCTVTGPGPTTATASVTGIN